ncbi:MAG TPA: IS110 family transposase [Burkholderiales bacterium]|nr:IS110 family transposase [Burkholderiales bacterium]
MRAIGLDVHLEFCEVAIAEAGEIRSAGRIATKPEALKLFAQSLGAEDRVALEVTGNAWEIKRIIEPYVDRVLVVSPNDTGIRQARAKTDRLDARTLARLLASGELDSVWVPDRATWMMRRRLQRRGQLVWARSRAKNQIHATLMRCLVGRAPFREPFGPKGRRWLSGLALPEEERESVDSALRQIEFLDAEIAAVERLIATEALKSPEIGRLMTVPGVNLICAATFLAAIGDIRRFESSRTLTGYLGLDPRVSQSGTLPATHGRISKQGSMRARHALVEASWSTVRQPGPLRAFYERIRARRGHQVAVVACARKLACLFWCLLTREQDYAYAQPSLTAKKLRLLEIRAGAKTHKGSHTGVFATRQKMRAAERMLSAQAEAAYRRTVADWHATQTKKKGAGATPGRASRGPSSGQAARQVQAPRPAL